MRPTLKMTVLLFLVLLLVGCQEGHNLPTAVLPAATRPVLPTPTLQPTAQAPDDSSWTLLRPGLEQREIKLYDQSGQQQEQLIMVRLDPAFYRFDVAYRPGSGQDILSWQAETGAMLVVNGGFFSEEYLATGLTVHQGQASGTSYEGFGGMFAVTEAGPEVRSLQEQPYNPQEPLLAGLQSFPILVKPGGQPGFPEEDGQRARRTVVAQDSQGRLLFLVAPWGHFTLYELSRYLAASDLQLTIALNLDGGPSSGLLVEEGEAVRVAVPAFSLLPAVIVAYPR